MWEDTCMSIQTLVTNSWLTIALHSKPPPPVNIDKIKKFGFGFNCETGARFQFQFQNWIQFYAQF